MKFFSWVLKISVILLFCLLSLATIILAIIIWKPEKIITSSNLHFIASKIKSHGLDFNWSEDEIKIQSHSFFQKRFDFAFKNLCFNLPSVEVHGCFEALKIGGTISFSAGRVRMNALGPLLVHSNDLFIDLKPSKSKKKKKSKLFSEFITQKTIVHEVEVDVNSFKYVSGESTFEGSLKVNDSGLGSEKLWKVLASLRAQDKKNKAEIEGHLELDGDKSVSLPLELKGDLNFSSGESVKAKALVNYKFVNQESGDYKINLSLDQSKNLSVRGELKGKIDNKKTTGILDATIITPNFKIPLGSANPCSFDVAFKGNIGLDCPFKFVPRDKIVSGLDVSKDFKAIQPRIKIDLKSRDRLDAEGPWDGSAILSVSTLAGGSLAIDGEVKSEVSNSPLNKEILKKLKTQTSLKVLISKFEQLVVRLKSTPYAVPAPLNVLNGQIECDFKSNFVVADLEVPFQCNTNLKSEGEALKLEVNGDFKILNFEKQTQPNLDLNVLLKDIQLALPRFGIKGPPPLFPDSTRFKRTLLVAKSKNSFPLNYKITIETSKTSPIRILSNLAKAPIPVDLNLVLSNANVPVGWVRIKEFPAQLFRRDARVKFFEFHIAEKEKESIHGLLEVHYTDYKIKIMIEGTAQEPIINFESEPPLAQDEIISVLLFGRKLSEANSDQTSSVTNTQAAVADKALALSSMYVLASTPIESIGYNSQSQTFTAKIHITEGTSLDVGTADTGVKEVGVNRHLGGPWYIYTFLKNPTESEDRSTAAFLEWVMRY